MTTIPQPLAPSASYLATYDAWNRLVEVKDGATVVTTNEYDGLNRRIVRISGGETRHFYYTQQWQVIEESVGSDGETARVDRQYVWGPGYVDELVASWRDTDGSYANGLEEAHYYLQDANFNVTAVTNNAGAVVERYAYTPYGEVTFLDASFSAVSGNVSTISNEHLYTGRRLDPETGLQLNRNRFYAAGLGRWVNRDPIEYAGSWMNLYAYVNGMPLVGLDPDGLIAAQNCDWDHLVCVSNSNKKYQNCYKNTNGSWWKNYLCELANNARKARCTVVWTNCKALQGLECCFATAGDALDWARRNPKKVVIGATVCVAGATFIWATGGAGAPILVAL